MKRLIIVCALLAFLSTMSGMVFEQPGEATEITSAHEETMPLAAETGSIYDTNYMAQIITSLAAGDLNAAKKSNVLRNTKIDTINSLYCKVDIDDMYLIAKIIQAEAGSDWLSDDWKLCVGEVVLNRVASPEFPDSVEAVITQKGQYYGANSTYFNNLIPSERCIKLALRLLEGERILNNASVVFQANFVQGSGYHTALYDKYLGWTYFCYSSNPGLYE